MGRAKSVQGTVWNGLPIVKREEILSDLYNSIQTIKKHSGKDYTDLPKSARTYIRQQCLKVVNRNG